MSHSTDISPSSRHFDLTQWISGGMTLITVLALTSMAALFVLQSLPVWQHEGVAFFSEADWHYRQESFGMLSMLYGTLVVAAIALLFSVPIGIGAAIFASEFLPSRMRLPLKTLIELLAGVPSVVFGLLGVLILRQWIYNGLELSTGDTLLTGGILLGIMILPTVMTLSEDALQAVPERFRKAGRGLGLTRTETALQVALPQAWPGIFAAVLLGFGRAAGETIAVYLVIGRRDNQLPNALWDLAPLTRSGQTITSKLGGSEFSEAYADPLHWGAIMGLAVVLLLVSAVVTISGRYLITRRESKT
jgi:phosphate transport system permease protein